MKMISPIKVFLNWYAVVETMLNSFLKEKDGDNTNIDILTKKEIV